MSEYTPGPWELCARGDYTDFEGDSVVIFGRNDCRRVAVVNHHGHDEDEANARLIAAAPDLIKAAKLAVSEFENEGQVFRDAIQALKMAIEKSEVKKATP